MSNFLSSVGKPLAQRTHKFGPKTNGNDYGGPKAIGDSKEGRRRERKTNGGLEIEYFRNTP
jgi:hypothetical protein